MWVLCGQLARLDSQPPTPLVSWLPTTLSLCVSPELALFHQPPSGRRSQSIAQVHGPHNDGRSGFESQLCLVELSKFLRALVSLSEKQEAVLVPQVC